MRAGLRLLLLLGLTQAGLMAGEAVDAEQTNVSLPVRIRFLPPPMEGNFTLGVYDQAGQRVRLLAEAAGIDQFELARDGLEILWDGRDDDGHPLPHGNYSVRGALIGRITARRVAVHELPARADAESRVSWADGIAFHGKERLLLTATTIGGNRVLVTVVRNGTVANNSPLAADTKGISTLDDAVVADSRSGFSRALHWNISGDQLRGHLKDQPFGPPQALIDLNGLPDPSIISWEESPLVLSRGRLWRIGSNSLAPFPTELQAPVLSASSAGPERLWVIAVTARGNVLMQLLANGAIDRVLEAEPESVAPSLVAGMAGSDEVATLGNKEGVQWIRWIRRAESVEGESTWEIVVEHALQTDTPFALENDSLIAATGTPSPGTLRVRLHPDEIGVTARPVANVRPVIAGDRVMLEDEKHLPLLRLNLSGAMQVMLAGKGQNGTARLFVRLRTGIEEYLLQGLDDVTRFDCGAYRLGPK